MLSKFDQTSSSGSRVHKQLAEEPILEYKLLILGDPMVGISTFIKRFKSFQSDSRFFAHSGLTIFPLTFETNHGKIRFNIWDFPSSARRIGFREKNYIGTDCAILMFDLTSRITYKNIPRWHRDCSGICEKIPMVLVGNKIDDPKKKIKARHVTFGKKKCLEYFETSAKANYNVIEPFLYLMRKLVGDSELEILEYPELELPEIEITSELIATLIEEKFRVSYSPPHSDDDF